VGGSDILEGASIYSWIGILHPKGIEKSRISNSGVTKRSNRTTIISALLASTYALVQTLSALRVTEGNALG